jgi:hypothetical protein
VRCHAPRHILSAHLLPHRLALHAWLWLFQEEIFHLSSTNWTQKSALQDKLNWVIKAGLEDLDDPDYMVGGERCSSAPALSAYHALLAGHLLACLTVPSVE